ncbi:MAG TPA: hypothetical protein PK568_03610 [Bacillota bacterium]|nr:hypothetical protein [Bacillota bacterium]
MPFHPEASLEKSPYLLFSGEEQYFIFPGPGGELMLQRGSGAAWDEPRLLVPRVEKYCAALDSSRLPHLVFTDRGSFYHLVLAPEREEQAPTLFYRDESKECGHFLLAGDRRGGLHFICLAIDPAAKRWWLLHHRYSGSAWEEPRVIDFGSGTSQNYGELAVDARDCLHLAYRVEGAGQAGLYYRSFDPESDNWSKALPLSDSAAVDCPSIAVDRQQNLHLLWRGRLDGRYYVYYRFMGGPEWKRSRWRPETAISPGLEEPPFPFICHQAGGLFIQWLEGRTLRRYRFAGDQWERTAPQHFENPLLLRSSALSHEGSPLSHWILVESGGAAAGAPLSSLLQLAEEDLESDFHKLRRYSDRLIGRISHLSTAKDKLEKEVQEKKKEILLLSQQSERAMRQLRQELEGKDAELKKLREDFNGIVESMKQKIEQGSRQREAERKRYLEELQGLRKERRQMEKILQEKEKTIARLEAQLREQQYQMERLREENEMLTAKAAERWSLKKLWERIALHKKPLA